MNDMKKKAEDILEDYSNSYSQVDLETLAKFLDQIKSEAIKKFAERVKQEINFPLAVWRVFDNIVEEMTE